RHSSGTAPINELPLTGGTVTTLFNGQDQPWGVAVDSGHIYWTNSGDGTIKEAPLTGGPGTTLATRQDNPEGSGGGSGQLLRGAHPHKRGGQRGPADRRPGDHPGHRAALPGRGGGQSVASSGPAAAWGGGQALG